jgi:voltage-gated potassium channel
VSAPPQRPVFGHTNRRAALRAAARTAVSVAAIVFAYYWIPAGDARGTDLAGLVFLTLGLAVFAVVFYRQVSRVTRADHPLLRAIEALCSILALFVCLYSLMYYASSVNDAAVFSEPLTRTDALYYTVTVFSTVGFGDITPVGTPQRVMTMTQMLLDIAFLGVLVRVLTVVTQATLAQRGIMVGRQPAVPLPMPEPGPADTEASTQPGEAPPSAVG